MREIGCGLARAAGEEGGEPREPQGQGGEPLSIAERGRWRGGHFPALARPSQHWPPQALSSSHPVGDSGSSPPPHLPLSPQGAPTSPRARVWKLLSA